jgi:hypothetical protein
MGISDDGFADFKDAKLAGDVGKEMLVGLIMLDRPGVGQSPWPVSAFSDSTIAARRTYVAVAAYMFDLTVAFIARIRTAKRPRLD